MKKLKMKYIACNPHATAYGQIHERYLVETKEDLAEAFDKKLITLVHLTPMRLRIANGDKLVLNDQGGWCVLQGTWEIVGQKEKRFTIKWEIDEFAETPLEAIRKAIAAFPHENNTDTLATVFDVEEIDGGKVVETHQIDILDEDGLPVSDLSFDEIQDKINKQIEEDEFNDMHPENDQQ